MNFRLIWVWLSSSYFYIIFKIKFRFHSLFITYRWIINLKEVRLILRQNIFCWMKISTIVNVYTLQVIVHHKEEENNFFYESLNIILDLLPLAYRNRKTLRHTTIIIFMGTNLLRYRGKRLLYSSSEMNMFQLLVKFQNTRARVKGASAWLKNDYCFRNTWCIA